MIGTDAGATYTLFKIDFSHELTARKVPDPAEGTNMDNSGDERSNAAQLGAQPCELKAQ